MITIRVTLCGVCQKTISADWSYCGGERCINEDFKRGRIAGLEAAAKHIESIVSEHRIAVDHVPGQFCEDFGCSTLVQYATEIRKLKEKP